MTTELTGGGFVPPADAQLLIEMPPAADTREVLRAEPEGEVYRILSVPVFLADISRGTLVEAAPDLAGRLEFRRVYASAPGATVRCYVSAQTTLRRAYEDHMSGGVAERLGLGPVTLVEPDVLAVHVAARERLGAVAAYLDRLILAGVLRVWVPSDPAAPDPDAGARGVPLELIHPPADPWPAASRPAT